MKTILIAILAGLSVALAGVLGWYRHNLIQSAPNQPVVNQPVVEQPVVNQPIITTFDEIVEWKTFTNEQYSLFEFKYPADWTVEQAKISKWNEGLLYILIPPNDEKVQVKISVGGEIFYTNIDDYFIKKWINDDKVSWNVSNEEFIQINSLKFYRYQWVHQYYPTNIQYGETYVTVKDGGGDIEFEFSSPTVASLQGDTYQKFQQIVSALKFIK